jgi:subtilisin family serine protease
MTPNNTKDGDTAHPNDLFGWNFVNNTNNPLDDNGHGTNVSGILGAVGNNGMGVAGVDWNVQIMPIKFLGSDGQGAISAFIQGLNYAVQHGAKISNNSWEGAPYSQALYDAINNARAHGQIFVAAAGNESANDDATADYPASFSQSLNNVVAVAATDSSDHLASFSNWGPHSVDLAAPGVNILSTLPNGQYGAMSGTSMATPEVTGALALVWGLHPNWSYTQVINQVLNSVDKLPSLQGKVASGGRLDVAAAVGWNLSTRTTPLITSIRAEGPTPTSTTMDSLWLTFNEPIDVSTFSSSLVRLTDSTGKVIPVIVRVVNNSGDRQMALIFPNQTVPGNYQLSLSSGIYDLMGNALAPYQATITVRGEGSQTYTNSTAAAIQAGSLTMSTLSVPSGGSIGGVQVRLDISYPDDGELYIYLIAPNGKAIAMTYNRGGRGVNFQNTVFADQVGTPIAAGQAPFAGSYRPDSALSQLNSLSAAGTWRLAIKDSGGHGGTLLSWSLILTPAGAAPSVAMSSLPPTAPVNSASPAAEADASGQSAGDGQVFSIASTLPSEGSVGESAPPAPADHVFASPVAMTQIQTGWLVSKRPSRSTTSEPAGTADSP